MAYTTIDDPSAYFQTTLYTGNGTAIGSGGNAITNSGNSSLQPDMVWIKNRVDTDSHSITDSVRGVTKYVLPDSTSVADTDANGLAVFGSNGFTVGSNNTFNGNTHAFVSWNWKAGTSFTNDASGTSIGNTDSTGSFNNTAGFSIVSYNGVGSSLDIEIKHGLNTVPAVIITKNLDDANHWAVFHHKNTSAPETDFLKLSNDTATTDDGDIWNDVAPTNAIFTAGDHSSSNRAGNAFVAYCFSEKQGYSKFGSYTGNNLANGPFIATGFQPAWVMVKKYTATNHWIIWDNKRSSKNGANIIDKKLYANLSHAENGANDVSFLSNGFKLHTNTGDWNEAESYVYLAFAEHPFVTSTGIPTTAR